VVVLIATQTNIIRVPTDPRSAVRVCEAGLHEIPISVGNGSYHDWKASGAEFDFWKALDKPKQNELLRESLHGCFLCALDRKMKGTWEPKVDNPNSEGQKPSS